MKKKHLRNSGRAGIFAAGLALAFTAFAAPSQQAVAGPYVATLDGPRLSPRPQVRPRHPRPGPVFPTLNCRRVGPISACKPTGYSRTWGKRKVLYKCRGFWPRRYFSVVRSERCRLKPPHWPH